MRKTVRYDMSRKDIVELYQHLIAKKRISHNGAGFRRMIELNNKLNWRNIPDWKIKAK